MTNNQILATLHNAGIRTLGDLDRWRSSRDLSRWQALDALVGESAADRILGALAVNLALWALRHADRGLMSLIRFPLELPPVAKPKRRPGAWLRAGLGFLTLLIVLAFMVYGLFNPETY